MQLQPVIVLQLCFNCSDQESFIYYTYIPYSYVLLPCFYLFRKNNGITYNIYLGLSASRTSFTITSNIPTLLLQYIQWTFSVSFWEQDPCRKEDVDDDAAVTRHRRQIRHARSLPLPLPSAYFCIKSRALSVIYMYNIHITYKWCTGPYCRICVFLRPGCCLIHTRKLKMFGF